MSGNAPSGNDESVVVENSEEAPHQVSDPGANPNRAKAVEAVKKALAQKTEKSEKSEPKPKTEPKAEAKAKPEPEESDDHEESDDDEEKPKAKAKSEKGKDDDEVDPDKATVRHVLQNRVKNAQEKKRQQDELTAQRQQFEQERQRFEYERRQIEAQRKQLEKFKTNPVEAVREYGWEPQDFIMNLANDGTPEGKKESQLRAMQARLEAQEQFQKKYYEDQQRAQQEAQRQYELQFRNHMEQRFLGHAYKEADKPFIASFYKGREAALIAEADLIAYQFRAKTGREATPEEIADYIEEDLADKAKSWYDRHSKSLKVRDEENEDDSEGTEESESDESDEPTARAPGVKKTGRTINPQRNGERRALQKSVSDMNDEERRQAAIEEVKKAIAKNRRAESNL